MAEPLQVYSYNRCSTCRKALAWLTDQGIAHDVHDIVENPPSRNDLDAAFAYLGDRKLLFNTSGQSYRALGSAVVKAMSDSEALAALAKDGKLIKRPFVKRSDGSFLVGFKPEVWASGLQD
ncbi:MAG: arsenate reductase family protein [Synechococcus sp. cluster2_bin.209]|nr:arsenate reductase family protein [Synechococcus sp. cluster2_bin.209]